MYRAIFLSILLIRLAFVNAEQLLDLKAILDEQKGQSVIEIPQGRYLLNNEKNGSYRFTDLKDVEIKGNGSEIICNSQEQALKFYNCLRVKISDLSVDYDPLCFTQGIIVEMAEDGSWFDVEIDQKYPIENVVNHRVQFYDPLTRELKRNAITTGSGHYSELTKIGDRRFRSVKSSSWTAGEKIGDLVVFDVLSRKANPAAHCIYLEKCEEMDLQDVAVYGSNSFAIFERECKGTHYNHCMVDRGKSPSCVAPRLRSSNADGIHSSLARKGPLVENCEVRHTGDDCIIVCGRSFPVCKIDEATKSIYVLSRDPNPVFAVGDNIQHVFYSGVKNEIVRIESIEKFTPTLEEQQLIQEKYPTLLSKDSYTKGVVLQLKSVPANIAIGDIVFNNNSIGDGFIIRNNKIGSNRSRGILIKGSNGVVEGNKISNCAMNGILVAPEIHWMGGGFADNVEIKNNTIKGCMFEKTNTGMPPGALSVFYANGALDVSEAGSFTNISVHDNTIEDCPYPAVVFTSVKGLSYERNTIIPTPDTAREHGKKFGVNFEEPLWEKNNIK